MGGRGGALVLQCSLEDKFPSLVVIGPQWPTADRMVALIAG